MAKLILPLALALVCCLSETFSRRYIPAPINPGLTRRFQYPNIPGIINPPKRYPAPESLKANLVAKYRLLVSGAATNPYPEVAPSMQLPIMGTWENYTRVVQSDIQDGIRHIIQTKNEWTFALHGTGLTGMSTVLDNLIEPGDKIVIGVYGYWGDVVTDMAQRYEANVIKLEKPWGQRLSMAEIEFAVARHRPKILFVISGESSTGVYQPFDGIGEICHRYNCISVVDLVGTIGVVPIKMDERKIDVIYSNSQKGCGGIVGLAPISFSQRAVDVVKKRKTLPRMRNHDIQLQTLYSWFKSAESLQFLLHSISLPLLYTLREGLAHVANEGIENVWERHADVDMYFKQKARELGLEFFVPKEENRLVGTTTFKIPTGKDIHKLEQYILDNYAIEISGGVGSTSGKVLRVGLFGNNARRDVVDKTVDALRDALACSCTNANATRFEI